MLRCCCLLMPRCCQSPGLRCCCLPALSCCCLPALSCCQSSALNHYLMNHYQPRRVNAQEAKPVRDAIQRDTAFNLPELKEEDGFAVMEFPYLAATDDVMLPEDDED